MSRLIGLLTFLFAATAWAENPGVAVLDIQGTGVDPALLPTLTEILTVEIDALGTYKVIAGQDVQAMLGFEKQKDVVGCTEAACLAEIGGALGVDRIVAGHIGKVGETYVVNIKLINIKMATTEGRVYETVKGQVDALIDTIRKSVGKLFHVKTVPVAVVAAEPPAKAPVATASQHESTPAHHDQPGAHQTGTVNQGGSRVAPVILMGLGVASAGLGALLGMKAQQQEKCASDSTCVGGQVAAAQAPGNAQKANIAFGAGAAAAGVGLIWFLLSGPSDSGTASLAPTMTANGLGLAYGGQF